MNAVPSLSGLVPFSSSGSTFVFEGDHEIADVFSVSHNNDVILDVTPTDVEPQIFPYLENISSDVQTQINTTNQNVASLHNNLNNKQ